MGVAAAEGEMLFEDLVSCWDRLRLVVERSSRADGVEREA